MGSPEDGSLVAASAESIYADGHEIWPLHDRWHRHSRDCIDTFVRKHATQILASSQSVLDVGCGNGTYDWMPPHSINCDKFFNQIRDKPRAVVADLEKLPFATGTFDIALCLGSVTNYVSAHEALVELARVIAPGGHLVFDFESSSSFEHVGRSFWNQQAHLNRTHNTDRSDLIWVYAPGYIERLLALTGFRVSRVQSFHVLSSLLARLGVPPTQAASGARYDRYLPWLRMFADNLIVLAERI